jgi:hypothetical protein
MMLGMGVGHAPFQVEVPTAVDVPTIWESFEFGRRRCISTVFGRILRVDGVFGRHLS